MKHHCPFRKSARCKATICSVAVALLVVGRSQFAQAVDNLGSWEHAPYRVTLVLALDAPGQLKAQLERDLPERIVERASTAIGPVWRLKTHVANAALRHKLLAGLHDVDVEDFTDKPGSFDKLIVLTVRCSGGQFDLRAREFDVYVQRWSATLSDICRQYPRVAERVFELLLETFSPLAQLTLSADDEDIVFLDLKGTAIGTKDAELAWVHQGDVFLPILRRTTRDGELVAGGLQPVPWTYVSAEAVENGRIVARIHSGTRRPFGVRRRGRIEQVAVALHGHPEPISIHVHSRTDPNKPLVGYEVFAQNTGEESVTRIGLTDRQGQLVVPPGPTRVQLLYLKNGGELLARVPVVPGAERNLNIPLPDDDPRLKAEATLVALRENLVDLVAQRNILMATIRHRIDDGKLDRAAQLLDDLDSLPGRAQFDRELTKQQQLHYSSDAQIQRRIDRLFAETRQLLGHFLDARAVIELRGELDAARNKDAKVADGSS